MKNVLVTGYFNCNLGDDLFFHLLFKRYSNVIFHIVADLDSVLNFVNYENVVIHEKKKYSLYDRFIDKFIDNNHLASKYPNYIRGVYDIKINIDCIVTIGGSIFIENEKTKIPHVSFYECLKVLYSDVPHFFLGCNFGPYLNESFYLDYDKFFSNVADVCFREISSYNLFSQLPNVRVAPDIAFNLKCKRKKEVPNSLGISIIDLLNRSNLNTYNDNYLLKLKHVVEDAVSKNYKVKLFSFCKDEGDEKAISNLISLLSKSARSNIRVCKYSGNLSSFLDEYSEMEYMISTRFHAMILSFIFDQICIPIVYSDKMLNVLTDLNYKALFYNISDLGDLDFDKILSQSLSISNQLDYIRQQSGSQFLKLDLLLNEQA